MLFYIYCCHSKTHKHPFFLKFKQINCYIELISINILKDNLFIFQEICTGEKKSVTSRMNWKLQQLTELVTEAICVLDLGFARHPLNSCFGSSPNYKLKSWSWYTATRGNLVETAAKKKQDRI